MIKKLSESELTKMCVELLSKTYLESWTAQCRC